MDLLQMLLIALAVSAGTTALVVIIMLLSPWKYLSKNTPEGQKNLYRIRKFYNNLAIWVYYAIRNFKPTYIVMLNLSASLKHRYMMEDDESKVAAISLLIKDLLVGIAATVFCLYYFDDLLLSAVTVVMMVMYAHQKFLGDGRKFLEELEELISDIVHIYNAEGKNIDMMFTRILRDRDAYLYRYVDKMYAYIKKALLDTENSQTIINEYNRTAPSRHLRLMFNYIYITARYGDEVNSEGEQLFNRNMLAIQREVHSDIIKMKSINDATIGEQAFIVLAVLIIPAATWYMEEFFTFEGFEAIGRFLNSSFGYAIKIVCSLVSLICFFIYSKMAQSNVAFEEYQEINWSEQVLNKNEWVKEIIDFLAPAEGSERRKKLENDVLLSEGYIGIRPLYLKKIITALVVTVLVTLMLSVDTISLYRVISDDIYRGLDRSLMDTVLAVAESPEEYKSRSITNDMIVVDLIDEQEEKYFSLPTKGEKLEFICELIDDNNIDYGAYPEVAAQRIYEKYVQLGQIDLPVILSIILIIFLGSYMIPNLSMKLKLALNQGAIIYDEVMGCYTVVILLINHSSSNVYVLFKWLTSFTNVFRNKIQQCLDNLSEKEIRNLENGVDYKPFSRLVECILLAYNGADLKSAFAGIEQRHLFQEETRKLITEQVVKRRIAYSQILSWGALGCTFVLYIMAPMIIAIIEMLQQLL